MVTWGNLENQTYVFSEHCISSSVTIGLKGKRAQSLSWGQQKVFQHMPNALPFK